VEKQIKYAKQAGLKVALDLHQPPFQGVDNFEQADFWKRKDLEGTFCQVWTEIAKRLLPYKDVIWGYDLLNEPLDRSQLPGVTRQWQPLAIKIIKAIRKVDPDTWIIFEPGPGSLFSGFKGLSPLPDLHIIYSAHFYNPQDFTHQGVFNTAGTDLEHAMEQINIDYPSTISGVPWDKQRLEGVLRDADLFQARWKVRFMWANSVLFVGLQKMLQCIGYRMWLTFLNPAVGRGPTTLFANGMVGAWNTMNSFGWKE
jgi:hypothetical protein